MTTKNDRRYLKLSNSKLKELLQLLGADNYQLLNKRQMVSMILELQAKELQTMQQTLDKIRHIEMGKLSPEKHLQLLVSINSYLTRKLVYLETNTQPPPLKTVTILEPQQPSILQLIELLAINKSAPELYHILKKNGEFITKEQFVETFSQFIDPKQITLEKIFYLKRLFRLLQTFGLNDQPVDTKYLLISLSIFCTGTEPETIKYIFGLYHGNYMTRRELKTYLQIIFRIIYALEPDTVNYLNLTYKEVVEMSLTQFTEPTIPYQEFMKWLDVNSYALKKKDPKFPCFKGLKVSAVI